MKHLNKFLVCLIALSIFSTNTLGSGHNKYCKIADGGGGVTEYEQVIVFGNGDGYKKAVTAKATAKKPVAVLFNKQNEYSLARESTKRDLPKGSVVLANYSFDPDPGLINLTKSPKKVVILHDIPLTEINARKIHGEIFDETRFETQVDDLKYLTSQLKQVNAVDLNEVKGLTVRNKVMDVLKGADENTLVVYLGHNSNGIIKFHDGSMLFAEDLSANNKGTTWIFSCNWLLTSESKLSISSSAKINYRTAVEAASNIKTQETYMENMWRLQNKFKVKNPEKLDLPVKIKESVKDKLLKQKDEEKKGEDLFNFIALQRDKNTFEFNLAVSETTA